MRTLTEAFPGVPGYRGASLMLEVLAYALGDAIAAGEPTGSIVLQIGWELLDERGVDLQQRIWEPAEGAWPA